MTASISTAAYAKLNLHLEVLGRRPDGFHELRTVLQSIDLHDTLQVTATDTGHVSLEVEPAGVVPTGDSNLVFQAAQTMRSSLGIRSGVHILLHKRVPVGAGLGGGSADAAAILRALPQLWKLVPDPDVTFEIAASLGSDVPFLLSGGTALGVGRGEEVYRLPELEDYGVVVAWPECSVSTATVYARVDAPEVWRQPSSWLSRALSRSCPWPEWERMRNDLQGVVESMEPQVRAVREAIVETSPLLAAVTGSGAASFGVYSSPEAARCAAESIAARAAGTHVGRFQHGWPTALELPTSPAGVASSHQWQ